MNWEIFSSMGYASIALWLCMPLLWLVHWLLGRRGWLVHIALLLGVAAFVLAKINSEMYVNRIQIDRGDQIEEQLARQELARHAATEAREEEVAPIRFAEDNPDDFLDLAGMDESDLKYFDSFNDEPTPRWRQEKKERSAESVDDSLQSQIGAIEQQEGVASTALLDEEAPEPILMSDRDKLAADRLDHANLTIVRLMLAVGLGVVVVDYLRRANMPDRAYFPLPLPSSWVDAMTPREPVIVRASPTRKALLKELRIFARRGESFVVVTDDAEAAAQAATTVYRLPLRLGPVNVLNVANYRGRMDDDFVFETLWYGRNSFVVDSSDRGKQLLERCLELLQDRRATRARVRRTVHIVWDTDRPISEPMRQQFATLGAATGYVLLLCREGSERAEQNDTNKSKEA